LDLQLLSQQVLSFSRKGAKEELMKRGSALRLCAFAGENFFQSHRYD
jgi:hypothetical protein